VTFDLLSNLSVGLSAAFALDNLFYCFAGVLLGTLIGVLPGIGTVATIAMLLPVTFGLPPVGSLIMLSGIYYGAQYGGSTTAILINLPGESSSVVTAVDGYQMARNGRAGVALATAAIGSFFAGTVATILLALFAPPLAAVALTFGPAEYSSLMVLGLIASIALASGSLLKAFAMMIIGLLLGLGGQDIYTGAQRFTLGMVELIDGFEFIAIVMGMFGIAEVIRNLEDESTRSVLSTKIKNLFPSRADIRGILPGGGAMLSSFASYALEKRLSRHPETFGRGALAGVAGPESANNAGAQTSFIPMLTLGIPSNPVMALMIGALIIQGITPGPNVVNEQPVLFWGLIVSMWLGNLMLVVLNLPLVGIWVKLLSVPYHFLFPVIIVFCSIGVFSVNNAAFDVTLMAIFAAIGYVLVKLDCEPAPLLLGFVVGPMLEENIRRAMLVSRGEPAIFIERPISAGLLLIAVVTIVAVTLPAIRKGREQAFKEE
jgi:putative tricarboxylic transport membrane protein